MAIVHLTDVDGGFTCGDTATGLTSYAYPSSRHATVARKSPDAVAAGMLRFEGPARNAYGVEYDKRNWLKLRGGRGNV